VKPQIFEFLLAFYLRVFLCAMSRLKPTLLIVVFLLSFSGSPLPEKPNKLSVSLDVPLIPQIGHNWCWAAVTEMCMRYWQANIDRSAPTPTQCQLAKKRFIIFYQGNTKKLADTTLLVCDPDSIVGSEFDLTGTPFCSLDTSVIANKYYTYTWTSTPLSWDSLCVAFLARKPVIFSWQAQNMIDSSYATHFLVAEGCFRSRIAPKSCWVSINDPWGLTSENKTVIARHSQITYDEYCNTMGTRVAINNEYRWKLHGLDYVISRK
jgi:hypothetical protein